MVAPLCLHEALFVITVDSMWRATFGQVVAVTYTLRLGAAHLDKVGFTFGTWRAIESAEANATFGHHV